MMELAGKTAFITGGASGLGLGMAKAFAERGMKLAIADILPAHLERARDEMREVPDCHFLQLDVTDRAAFARAADEAEQVLGPVSVLCNNAGLGLLGDIQSCTEDDWDWVLSVNLGGVLNGIKAFLPRMLACGEGHIVNTSSIGGILPGPGGAAYLASKAAVLGLSESIACDLRPQGIGVTVILPGPTASNIHKISVHRAAAGQQDTGTEDAPIIAGGMDPLVAGRLVSDAIERNQLYLFTHPEFRHALAQRFDAVMSSFGPEDDGPIVTQSYGFPTFNPLFAEILAENRNTN